MIRTWKSKFGRGGTSLLWLIAAAACLTPVMGCGGGGGTSSSPPSKQEFVREANLICEKRLNEKDSGVRRWMAGFGSHPKPPTEKQLEEVALQSVIPPLQQLTKELAGLTPPEGDAKTVHAVIAKIEAGLKVLEEAPAQAVQANVLTDGAHAAIDYGLASCTV